MTRIADGIDDCMETGGGATPGAVAEARAARYDPRVVYNTMTVTNGEF
jgi:hypothetical protein